VELVILNISTNETKVMPLDGKTEYSVGRSQTCDIVLPSTYLSRVHCLLTRDEAGAWWVTSLGLNGTFVNDAETQRDARSPVKTSDRIQLGDFVLVLRSPADLHAREAPARPVGAGIVAPALRRKLHELEADVHYRLLDTLRLGTAGPSDEVQRKLTVETLDKLLTQLEISPDLEDYLTVEALRELLLDRVHGYGKGGPQDRARRGVEENAARFKDLVELLANRLGVDPAGDPGENAERVETGLDRLVKREPQLVPRPDRKVLAVGLVREHLLDIIFGYGPLEDLMYADDVNDIMVVPSGDIFIERKGVIRDSGRRMLSSEVSRRIVERIIAREGRRIDQSSPMVDARVADGSRLNAIIEPVATKGPALTIRKFQKKRFTVDDLVERESLTDKAAEFLKACVLARKNIVLAGGTGSGKTTLLNVLASFIPNGERIVTVEDTAEIQLSQRHVVTLQAKPPNLEGKGAITIRQLVRNTLRMRPDRIIVGECRGGEALDMLQAMNTGHDGSLTTIHANSPWDALRRLEVMSMEAEGIDLPSRALREQIGSAVDVLIQVMRFSNGARRVTSICEVVGIDDDDNQVVIEEVFTLRRRKERVGLSGGRLAFTGYVPAFIDELLETGKVTLDTLF
jgi:Flp pilus assembly CpaF family ATPase